MSITINELSLKRSAIEDEQGLRYTRAFQAILTDPSESEKSIVRHSDLPAIYERHPNDENCILVSKNGAPEADRLKWIITCEYRMRNYTTTIDQLTDPTDIPPQITFDQVSYDKPVERAYAKGNDIGNTQDAQGSPEVGVVNSTSDQFDPPVIQEYNNMLIRIVRNEKRPDFDPDIIASFINTINSQKVTIAGVKMAKHEGRLRKIHPVKNWTGDGIEYYTVTYEIEVNRETHIRKILDQGFRKLDGIKAVAIRQEDLKTGASPNTEVSDPVRLDGSGGVLATDADSVYINYQTFFARNFSTLRLPRDS